MDLESAFGAHQRVANEEVAALVEPAGTLDRYERLPPLTAQFCDPHARLEETSIRLDRDPLEVLKHCFELARVDFIPETAAVGGRDEYELLTAAA